MVVVKSHFCLKVEAEVWQYLLVPRIESVDVPAVLANIPHTVS